MRRIVLVASVFAALMRPTTVSAVSFGDWASDQGYNPGDAMPLTVHAGISLIDSLDGIGEYDWTATPTMRLNLAGNQITSIESGGFDGLTNLTRLDLEGNQITSIESGGFDGLTNLSNLDLEVNQITSIESGDFDGLTNLRDLYLEGNQISSIESGAFSELSLRVLDLQSNTDLTVLNFAEAELRGLIRLILDGNVNITKVSLRNAALDGRSFRFLIDGSFQNIDPLTCSFCLGIGELPGITEMDLSGIDFVDITLAPSHFWTPPLYAMDDLTDLWLANTQNVDASALDVLLDNLETIEGAETEGVLYMTQADFDAFNIAGGGLLAAWNAEPGHHVEFVIPADLNLDGFVDGLDLGILLGNFEQNGVPALGGELNGTDPVDGFDLGILLGAWNSPPRRSASSVPEPSTVMLTGLAVIGLFARRGCRVH